MIVGDVGTVFRATVKDDGLPVNLSAFTVELLFKRPDKSTLTAAASFQTDGTDGKIEYVWLAGDVNSDGWWKVQARVIESAASWRTFSGRFRVEAAL
jgi:hypothetical protein